MVYPKITLQTKMLSYWIKYCAMLFLVKIFSCLLCNILMIPPISWWLSNSKYFGAIRGTIILVNLDILIRISNKCKQVSQQLFIIFKLKAGPNPSRRDRRYAHIHLHTSGEPERSSQVVYESPTDWDWVTHQWQKRASVGRDAASSP